LAEQVENAALEPLLMNELGYLKIPF